MEFVDHLKSSIDIVQVVGEYVRLRKMGQRYIGLCPFHSEKTPSFNVHPIHQFFKCFGCGKAGDAITFVMELDHLSFWEATKQLAERNGIPLPKRTEHTDADTRLRAALYQMQELAQASFRSQLASPAGAEARAYLQKRGVESRIAEEFGLGYAERGGRMLVRLLEKEGFNAEQMEKCGLLSRREDGSYFDRFRHRLMFPIHNESGKIVGFGGRALAADDEPKYLNSAETEIYKKSNVLYNLHRAKEGIRKSERVVLVEGYMDVIGVFAAGVPEVVASCGTSFTTQHIKTLRRLAGTLVVNFDPDTAGANGTERIRPLLEDGMPVNVVELEDGLDPDEYCKKHGREVYHDRLAHAKTFFHWLADRARAKFDMRTPDGRVAALKFLLPEVQRLPDKIGRAAVANDVAAYLGIETGLILENFRKAALDRSERPMVNAAEPISDIEKILLKVLVENPAARAEIVPVLRGMPAVETFAARRIFQAISALHETGAEVSFSGIHARLEEKDADVLSKLILTDETDEAAVSLKQGLACLEKLEAADRNARRAALKARIREAERSGDIAGALRLSQDLAGMEHTRG